QKEGADDEIRIEIPVGTYEPTFIRTCQAQKFVAAAIVVTDAEIGRQSLEVMDAASATDESQPLVAPVAGKWRLGMGISCRRPFHYRDRAHGDKQQSAGAGRKSGAHSDKTKKRLRRSLGAFPKKRRANAADPEQPDRAPSVEWRGPRRLDQNGHQPDARAG